MKKILRVLAVILAVFTLGTGIALAAAQLQVNADGAGTEDYGSNFPAEVLELVNRERAKAGVRPLQLAEDLTAAASIRAKELPRQFSHTRPDGRDCFTAIRRHYRTAGKISPPVSGHRRRSWTAGCTPRATGTIFSIRPLSILAWGFMPRLIRR